MIVRRATPAELPKVRALMLRTYVEAGYVHPSSPYVAELEAVDQRWREAELLVAVADAAVVGTVTFCLPGTPWAEISGPGEAEFRMLAVDEAHRRGGVGRALVQECLDRARSVGAGQVVISTTARMTEAHRMYRSMGFDRLPERDWDPNPFVHLLVFGVRLTDG